MKISNRVFVSTPFEDNKNIDIHFPWITFKGKKGIMLTLQGDLTDIHNLQKELQAVKDLVNIDANRFGIKLRDLNIKIEFVEEK